MIFNVHIRIVPKWTVKMGKIKFEALTFEKYFTLELR